jgi:hypothetical protein
MRDLGDLLYEWGVCIERPTQVVLSNPVNDVRHQISVDPTDYLEIHINHLKKDWHVGVPGTSLNKNHIDHPPLLRPDREADFRQLLKNPVMLVLTDRNRASPPLIGTGAK